MGLRLNIVSILLSLGVVAAACTPAGGPGQTGGAASGKRRAYTAPAQLKLNHWALSGDWTMQLGPTTRRLSSNPVSSWPVGTGHWRICCGTILLAAGRIMNCAG